MARLLLRFKVNLQDYSISPLNRWNGPLFHRWLPNGEADAITVVRKDQNCEFKLWFERFGFVDDGEIIFDSKRHEVDPNLMRKQAKLEAGPLSGQLLIWDLTEEEITPLKNTMTNDDGYIRLGKKVQGLLCPVLSKFINILRTNYGQYWIKPLEDWDSRECTIGSYCHLRLNLQWSLDEGQSWEKFMPGKAKGFIYSTMSLDRDFKEYLSEQDWQDLSQALEQDYEPSLAASILSLAHQLCDEDDLKHAFIEGVSALEIALQEFVDCRLGSSETLRKSASKFMELPLPAQITIVATTLKLPVGDVENAIKAVKRRNDVVHEGHNPPQDAKKELMGLMKIVGSLLAGPKFKFPEGNLGNAIRPIEEWESK